VLGAAGIVALVVIVRRRRGLQARHADLSGVSVTDHVGWCRLTVSQPVLTALMVSALETRLPSTSFNVCCKFQLAPLQPGVRAAAAQEAELRRRQPLRRHVSRGSLLSTGGDDAKSFLQNAFEIFDEGSILRSPKNENVDIYEPEARRARTVPIDS